MDSDHSATHIYIGRNVNLYPPPPYPEMPSIFKKKKAQEPAPEPTPDIEETIQKLNRKLEEARQAEIKARENAKNAMRNNNNVMAKTYLNQSKMAQQTQRNISNQLGMLQMKQN